MRVLVRSVALAAVLTILGSAADAATIDVYTVGSSPAGNALDPIGNSIGGIPTITFDLASLLGGASVLTIVAEGVDLGEHDQVFFNDVFIGLLTDQGFKVDNFNLQPGPGALAGTSALTNSIFNVNAIAGLNTVRIEVDSANWVNEIETASLESVPEPATLALLGAGLAGIARRRLRRNRA